MNSFLLKARIVLKDRSLLSRILFVLGILVVFRFLSIVPIPGVNEVALAQFLSGNQFFGLLNIFSGGALSQLSILMLGVGPFITASIILQLLTIMIPRLKDLYHHEGDAGRKTFNQYSRLLTIAIALLQGFGLLMVLAKQDIVAVTPAAMAVNLVTIVTGAFIAMWLGELINEYGIGNGVSMIIFAGIVERLPQSISQLIATYTPSVLPLYIGFAVLAVVMIAGIVMVTEAERPVPVVYAKQSRGGKVYGGTSSYIPLKLNQAGVMPIIFALSILLFPQMIGNYLSTSASAGLAAFGKGLVDTLNNGWIYAAIYFVLVVAFTFFYTAITFEPETMASNLQKNGAFVPGVRPGHSTTEYVSNVASRITLVGAVFLGLLAVLPVILRSATGIQSLALGGTSVLIAVTVVIDLLKKLDAQVSMRQY